MTELLARAFSEIKKLPTEDQDAIAQRLLAELKEDHAWKESFAKTTDEQWKRMIAEVDKDIDEGKVLPMNEVFPVKE